MTKYNKIRKKQVKTIAKNIKLWYNNYVNEVKLKLINFCGLITKKVGKNGNNRDKRTPYEYHTRK